MEVDSTQKFAFMKYMNLVIFVAARPIEPNIIPELTDFQIPECGQER